LISRMLNSHNRLCGPCQAIFEAEKTKLDNFDEDKIWTHYSNGTAFIASARSGRCYICTWAWRGRAATRRHEPIHHTESQLEVEDSNSLRLTIHMCSDGEGLVDLAEFSTWSTKDGNSNTPSYIFRFQQTRQNHSLILSVPPLSLPRCRRKVLIWSKTGYKNAFRSIPNVRGGDSMTSYRHDSSTFDRIRTIPD
jgi:hypothetical protein